MIPDRLYLLYLGANARECKACFMWESGENPLEISPAGLGVGIGQQSVKWQAENTPTVRGVPMENLLAAALATDRRWHPAFQIACYAEFIVRHPELDREGRWRCYHVGHPVLPGVSADADRYVEDVLTWWDKLVDWKP